MQNIWVQYFRVQVQILPELKYSRYCAGFKSNILRPVFGWNLGTYWIQCKWKVMGIWLFSHAYWSCWKKDHFISLWTIKYLEYVPVLHILQSSEQDTDYSILHHKILQDWIIQSLIHLQACKRALPILSIQDICIHLPNF